MNPVGIQKGWTQTMPRAWLHSQWLRLNDEVTKGRWNQYIAANQKSRVQRHSQSWKKWLKSRERDFHQLLLLTNLVLRSSPESAPIIEEQLQELSQMANAWVGIGSRQRKSPSNGSPSCYSSPPKITSTRLLAASNSFTSFLTSYKLTLWDEFLCV